MTAYRLFYLPTSRQYDWLKKLPLIKLIARVMNTCGWYIYTSQSKKKYVVFPWVWHHCSADKCFVHCTRCARLCFLLPTFWNSKRSRLLQCSKVSVKCNQAFFLKNVTHRGSLNTHLWEAMSSHIWVRPHELHLFFFLLGCVRSLHNLTCLFGFSGLPLDFLLPLGQRG